MCIGLPSHWVNLIMNCTKSNELNFLWNGVNAGKMKPTRGIRQGDPLSPYLFVFCIERLCHMILDNILKGLWKPVSISGGEHHLSHLMFADDVVLFAEASLDQIQVAKIV